MLLAVNYYDDKARVIQAVSDNHAYGLDYASTDYRYNGEVKQTVYTHISDFDNDGNADATDEDITLTETYTYDHAGRLLETELGVTDRNKSIPTTSQVLAANRYNELGELIEKYSSISGTTTKVASQKTDYRYNIRGWLTKINEPDLSGTDGDLFGMELAYNTAMSSLGATAQYNGNIVFTKWKNYNDATTKAYGFAYDDINRLLAADYGEEASSWANTAFDVMGEDVNGNATNIQYDANGNILSLRRNAVSGSALHNFVKYEYNGNQLTRLWEDGTDPGTDQYEYDANGNMTSDTRKGIENVAYNHLNLPETVDFDATGNNSIGYVYDAAGTKHLKLLTENGTAKARTDYMGSFVYVDGELSYILTSEGRLKRTSGTYVYEYQLKDHLGNTRVAFNGYDNGSLTPMQANDYYPFGLRHEPVNPENDNKYLYNGKEWQDDVVGGNSLEWYDFGFRFYDPALARFVCLDPLADKFHWVSPYNYAENRPIDGIDLWGLQYTTARYGNIGQYNRRPPTAGTISNIRYSPAGRMSNQLDVKYFEAQSPSSGGQMTRDNIFAQNVGAGVRGAKNILEHISDVSTTEIRSAEGKSSISYEFTFASKEAETEFNKAQSNYETKLNEKLSTLEEPAKPGEGASAKEVEKYMGDVVKYKVQKELIKSELGPSPKESIINEFNKNKDNYQVTGKKVSREPIFYEEPNVPPY